MLPAFTLQDQPLIALVAVFHLKLWHVRLHRTSRPARPPNSQLLPRAPGQLSSQLSAQKFTITSTNWSKELLSYCKALALHTVRAADTPCPIMMTVLLALPPKWQHPDQSRAHVAQAATLTAPSRSKAPASATRWKQFNISSAACAVESHLRTAPSTELAICEGGYGELDSGPSSDAVQLVITWAKQPNVTKSLG